MQELSAAAHLVEAAPQAGEPLRESCRLMNIEAALAIQRRVLRRIGRPSDRRPSTHRKSPAQCPALFRTTRVWRASSLRSRTAEARLVLELIGNRVPNTSALTFPEKLADGLELRPVRRTGS